MNFRMLRPLFSWHPPSNLPLLGLIAIGVALVWTLLGVLISVVGGSVHEFWREWLLIQGFFDVTAAIFLGFLALSPALEDILQQLSPEPTVIHEWTKQHGVAYCRKAIIIFVAVVGTITTTQLGFASPRPSIYFMWLTCVGVCILAGFATWHALEVIRAATEIENFKIKFFVYSPGETRSLKRLALYFVGFGLGMTFGYIFAFIGTMSPHWKGDPTFVHTVQAFWPMIYVPLCLIVTTYPHLAVHRLIRKEKDRLIICYQEQINSIIGDGISLSQDDIQKINALADLIKKIDRSPSFAVSFPIAIGAVITYIANIGSLFISKDAIVKIIRDFLPVRP